MKQLTARIHGHLRRVIKERENQNYAYSWNNDTIVLDLQTRSIAYKSNNVVIQATNFLLFLNLLQHADKALSRDNLLSLVWTDQYIDERTIDVQVKRLRAELDKIHPCLRNTIEAVRGIGYRFNSLMVE
jgi:DNA-binding response OmpR family regulator